MGLPPPRCPHCAWSSAAPTGDLEHLALLVEELEFHLAGDHDLTWDRATALARSWSQQVFAVQRELERQTGS